MAGSFHQPAGLSIEQVLGLLNSETIQEANIDALLKLGNCYIRAMDAATGIIMPPLGRGQRGRTVSAILLDEGLVPGMTEFEKRVDLVNTSPLFRRVPILECLHCLQLVSFQSFEPRH